ncbi:hypothetical protein [Microtetraspora malaysiensis]|uniref:hypothetical protein n=1 Tax=Microtetraspora malaysiensis TaxID=161358 RepID=UPI003D928010
MISYYTDLALGLVLAFLLLSLLVSGVNEGIVRLLGIRSKFLWAYLRDTLDGAEVAQRVPAALRVLPRVLDRLKGVGRWLCARLADLLPPSGEGRSRLPATVLGVFAKLPFGRDPRPEFSAQPAPVQSPPLAAAPGTVAAEVVAEMTAPDPAHGPGLADPEEIASATVATATLAFAGDGPDRPEEGKSLADLLHERLQEIDHSARGRTNIAQIPPARFAVALMEIATDMGGVERLMGELDTLRSPLYRPLKAVWDRASHDIEAFRNGVADWYDGEMQRLTMLYRRYVRWVIAALSLLVTVLFGMDSLEYGKSLLNDSAYRSSVAAFAQSGAEALAPLKERCASGEDTYTCVTDVLSTPAFVQIFTHAPVTVEMRAGADGPSWSWRGGDWWSRVASPSHWPGFLITLFALLFGAPFWWDVFRRVTGIRSRISSLRAP